MCLVPVPLHMSRVNAVEHGANVATAGAIPGVIGAGSFVAAWLLAAGAGVLAIAGTIFGWYALAWFDEGVYAFTCLAVTLLISLYLYEGLLDRYRRHPVVLVCTVVSTGSAIGVAWEWAESGYDRLAGPANAIPGKTDTLTDLLMDVLGALGAGLLMLRALRR